MSYIQDNEISIIWKIENFHAMPRFWCTSLPLEWENIENKRDMLIQFFAKEENKIIIRFGIKCPDYAPSFMDYSIKGTISSLKKTGELKLFNFNFREKTMFTEIEKVDWNEKGIFDDGSITFRIDIWNPEVKVEYFARSAIQEQICCFHWMLKGDRDWNNEGDTTECCTDIPMEFIDFWNMQAFKVNFSLQIKNDKTYGIIKTKYVESTGHFILCKYKMTVQRKDETEYFLDTEWDEIVISHKDNEEKLITEKRWDYLTNEWIVKVHIIIVTDVRGRIERINYKPSMQNVSINEESPIIENLSNDKLQSYMHILYNEGKFCDIMIHADGKYLPCHKDLLSDRSWVLKRKIKHRDEENIVYIFDIEFQMLKVFLTYLYLNILEVTNFGSLIKLYSIAHQYEVLDLQRKCAIEIKSSLSPYSIYNALRALKVADKYNDEYLKKEILSFFCENAEIVKRFDVWNYLSSEPLLAFQIKTAISNIVKAESNHGTNNLEKEDLP